MTPREGIFPFTALFIDSTNTYWAPTTCRYIQGMSWWEKPDRIPALWSAWAGDAHCISYPLWCLSAYKLPQNPGTYNNRDCLITLYISVNQQFGSGFATWFCLSFCKSQDVGRWKLNWRWKKMQQLLAAGTPPPGLSGRPRDEAADFPQNEGSEGRAETTVRHREAHAVTPTEP